MLSLTCRHSGQETRLHDGRIVMGGAAFCDIRVKNGSQQAVIIFAKYNSTWIAHNLLGESILKNGEPFRDRSNVSTGDIWQIGSSEYQSIVWEEVHDPVPPTKNLSECTLIVRGQHGDPLVFPVAKVETIIGSALYCDLSITEPRMKSQHFLVVSANGIWFLHSLLSGGGIDGQDGFSRIAHDDVVQVGRTRLEFRIRSRESNTLKKLDSYDSATASKKLAVKNAEKPTPQTSVPLERRIPQSFVETAPDVATQTAHAPAPIIVDAEVLRAAQGVLNRVKALHLSPRRSDGVLGDLKRRIVIWSELPHVETAFLLNAKISAFEKIGGLLEKDPWDRYLLMTFIRMCDLAGLDDICFHALRLLAQQEPTNDGVTRSLARLSRHMAGKEPTYFSKAIRYWKLLKQQSPSEESAIESTIRQILAEQAYLNIQRR